MDPILSLAPGLCRNRAATISREWLVTNGIGGYVMGTVAGANTRAYMAISSRQPRCRSGRMPWMAGVVDNAVKQVGELPTLSQGYKAYEES